MWVMENLAYFDNAATTFPKPECVYTAMDAFARTNGVSLGRGQHVLSASASALADNTRELLLELFHCSNKKVVFTNTATEALNIIIKGISVPDGANVYISPFEHNAVTRTLNYISQNTDFNLIQLETDSKTLMLDLDKIKSQFVEQAPFCVIVSHISNVTGSIAPIEQIFSLAKKYKAITIADMCQSAGLLDTDISSNNYDYVVFAGHKTLYGPLGISGFISAFPQKLDPIIIGGTGVESANQFMPEDIPIKYEAGSHNTTAIAGLNASLKWILEVGIDTIRRKEQENYNRLCDILDKQNNINYFRPTDHAGVVSCLFDGYSSDEIGQILSQNNIAVRTGLHCSPYAHKYIGTFPAGTVRFSVGFFNNESDFEKLNEILNYINENS